MLTRLLHMFLFIVSFLAIIVIMVLPMCFSTGPAALDVRMALASQNVAPKRLFIASWRNIKTMYFDSSMNNQDWFRWKKRYIKEIKTEDDVVVAVNSMLASLDDANSEFFTRKRFKMQMDYIEGNNDREFLKDKFFKSPPDTQVKLKTMAGIVTSAVVTNNSDFYKNPKKDDIIVKINDYTICGTEMNSAVKLIRGTSKISKAELIRNGELITLPILRGAMSVIKISGELLPENIVLISVYSLMGRNAPQDIQNIFNNFPDADGFIIDLRGNVGGLFANAIFISDMLIKNGHIVTIQYRNGTKIPITAQIDATSMSKPFVILTDKNTASSSEILASALRANGKAVLVGETTYGKNSIQQIIPMPNKTSLNLTTARCLLEDGKSSYKQGLIPDYTVKMTAENIAEKNDVQLKKAKEIIKTMKTNTEKKSSE